MAKNPALNNNTKHIELRFHFIHELVAKGEIIMKFCHIDVQVADIFTKALSSQRHVFLRSLLGVCDFESRGSIGDMIQNLLQENTAIIFQS